jgi:hypothetical protein
MPLGTATVSALPVPPEPLLLPLPPQAAIPTLPSTATNTSIKHLPLYRDLLLPLMTSSPMSPIVTYVASAAATREILLFFSEG